VTHIAGREVVFPGTPLNLPGQSLRGLLENPEQMRRFVAGEVETSTMVDELLRFITPVLHHSRWVTRDSVNGGYAFTAGDRVTPRLPWSGLGDAGVGVTLSRSGTQTFMRPKAWHLRSP